MWQVLSLSSVIEAEANMMMGRLGKAGEPLNRAAKYAGVYHNKVRVLFRPVTGGRYYAHAWILGLLTFFAFSRPLLHS